MQYSIFWADYYSTLKAVGEQPYQRFSVQSIQMSSCRLAVACVKDCSEKPTGRRNEVETSRGLAAKSLTRGTRGTPKDN
jgi:hypothetical protein